MTTTTPNSTPTGYLHVSQDQIDRCERIIDLSTNPPTVFYQCLSESDDTTIYVVRYNREFKRFSCTCPSGAEGFIHCAYGTCKHCRWAVAAEAEYQQYKRAERQAAARIEATAQYQHEQAEHALYTAEINLK
jgi:hypothetical protein